MHEKVVQSRLQSWAGAGDDRLEFNEDDFDFTVDLLREVRDQGYNEASTLAKMP